MRRIMKTVYIRWIAVTIGILATTLFFLGLHMTSLHSNDNTNDELELFHKSGQFVQKREVIKELLNVIQDKLETKSFSKRQPLKSTRELSSSKELPVDPRIPLDSGILKIKASLVELAREIHQTKIHIRGTKARESVTRAMTIVNDLLKKANISADAVRRKTQVSKHICGEIYKGTTYGYPFFYKGFEATNCSYATPVSKLITIVISCKYEPVSNIEAILNGISNYIKDIKVLIGTTEKFDTSKYSNVDLSVFSNSEREGAILNSLVKSVKTEYALIIRNLTTFNNDTRLDRLIREIERLDVSVAGGASRDQNGHWKLGCYQSAYKNYTLVYYEGYDESFHECIFCDYIDAPFVAKTEILKTFSFDKNMNGVSVYQDFFLRLSKKKHELIVCPDSMFYMHKQKRSNNPSDWQTFSEKWDLSRMVFSDEIDMQFSCKQHYRCFSGLGYTVTPCCLQELADMVKFIMRACEKYRIICELQEGTLLGAVKLHKVLPWERDADLTFLTANFTAFTKLKNYITNKYSYLDDAKSLWCCADNRTAGGKIKIYSRNWHIELYGQHLMDSEMLLADGIKPTKVLLDGQWVGVPRNPGWHARNRYGHEIYAHAQHWMATGKGDGWINYNTNQFTKCYDTGRHDCLDIFNADGNLQFGLPVP